MRDMQSYMILYRYKNEDLIDPWGFKVIAEDLDHAEEQFYNAEPLASILWVSETEDYNDALNDYYKDLNYGAEIN